MDHVSDHTYTARDTLRRVQMAQALSAADGATALASLAKAQAFVLTLEAEVKAFADVDAEVEAERASEIRRAIDAGDEPSIKDSDRLRKAAAKKLDAESRMKAARAAVRQIEAEVADANDRFKAGAREIIVSAGAVVAEAADDIAIDFLARLHELRAQFYLIRSLATLRIPLDPNQPKPPEANGAATIPITFSKNVRLAIGEHVVLGSFEANAGPRLANERYFAAMNFFTALRDDPDAQLPAL